MKNLDYTEVKIGDVENNVQLRYIFVMLIIRLNCTVKIHFINVIVFQKSVVLDTLLELTVISYRNRRGLPTTFRFRFVKFSKLT